MNDRRRYNLVLAIYPTTRGFAFALFEGALAPVDWGTVEVRGEGKNAACVRRVSQLFGRYAPDALVLQDTGGEARRAPRIRQLNDDVRQLAETQGIPVFAYSRGQVRRNFEHLGSTNKDAIADVIVKRIPAFEAFRPPVRKIWMSEDARMGIFDAAALLLTFYGQLQSDADDKLAA